MEWALQQVELAERDTPVCDQCGERTVPVAHDDGTVWLECASLGEQKLTLRRLLTLDFTGGHTRRLIVDPRYGQSAA